MNLLLSENINCSSWSYPITESENWKDSRHCSVSFLLSALGPFISLSAQIHFHTLQQTLTLHEPGTINPFAQRHFIPLDSGKATFVPFIDYFNNIFLELYQTLHLCRGTTSQIPRSCVTAGFHVIKRFPRRAAAERTWCSSRLSPEKLWCHTVRSTVSVTC